MSKVTKTIMESLKTMIPNDQAKSIESAINEFVNDTENKIKKEYEKTLEESYKEWQEELNQVKADNESKLQESENVALKGYEEARHIIEQKDLELQKQRQEFETFLEQEYKVAKSMLDKELSRNNKIEQDLYEAYNQQIEDIKEDLVNKIDNFLFDRIEDIAETVRRELKNSPEVLESKVAFDKIKNIVASSLDESDLHVVSNNNTSELQEQVSQLNAEIKALKARNLRLVTESKKTTRVINETTNSRSRQLDKFKKETERKVSAKLAENVEGRGKIINKNDLILEQAADTPRTPNNTTQGMFTNEDLKNMKFLAGYKD